MSDDTDELRTLECTHLHIGGQCVLLVPGPSHEYRREPVGEKWCFNCRARLPHDFVVKGDPPDVLSYYEPVGFYECSRCKRDCTQFPGTVW